MVRQSLTTFSCLLALAVAAAPTQSHAQSERLIPLVDGLTCWTEGSKRCFRYGSGNRRATRTGFRSVPVPASMEAKPGYITEKTFKKIEREINKQTGGNR
ncbi:MAG: hypothetical protein ACU0A6_10740 [Shimia sp.]|jgi:TRAP-type C4-dicarboxylate transport system substrate-binding protein|uniref:hypothetical protein n=1 Tax=Shimia sp. TaxID=1954381 RepID=UPI004057EDD7